LQFPNFMLWRCHFRGQFGIFGLNPVYIDSAALKGAAFDQFPLCRSTA